MDIVEYFTNKMVRFKLFSRVPFLMLYKLLKYFIITYWIK